MRTALRLVVFCLMLPGVVSPCSVAWGADDGRLASTADVSALARSRRNRPCERDSDCRGQGCRAGCCRDFCSEVTDVCPEGEICQRVLNLTPFCGPACESGKSWCPIDFTLIAGVVAPDYHGKFKCVDLTSDRHHWR